MKSEYLLYLISFVIFAFLAFRFFQAWAKSGMKQIVTLKLAVLFSIVTVIFIIATIDTNHTYERVIMVLCIIGGMQFIPEVLPKKDIRFIMFFSFSVLILILYLVFFR